MEKSKLDPYAVAEKAMPGWTAVRPSKTAGKNKAAQAEAEMVTLKRQQTGPGPQQTTVLVKGDEILAVQG